MRAVRPGQTVATDIYLLVSHCLKEKGNQV